MCFRPKVTALIIPPICGLCGESTPPGVPSFSWTVSSFPLPFVGDSRNRPARSFTPVPPPVRRFASPETPGFVIEGGFEEGMVKESPVIVDSIEKGVGREGEDGGESSPLVSLRGDVGGDKPMTWSRVGKFAWRRSFVPKFFRWQFLLFARILAQELHIRGDSTELTSRAIDIQ